MEIGDELGLHATRIILICCFPSSPPPPLHLTTPLVFFAENTRRCTNGCFFQKNVDQPCESYNSVCQPVEQMLIEPVPKAHFTR